VASGVVFSSIELVSCNFTEFHYNLPATHVSPDYGLSKLKHDVFEIIKHLHGITHQITKEMNTHSRWHFDEEIVL
jgi:hypothetical protein